jgi:ABC-2 type transport system permease protein
MPDWVQRLAFFLPFQWCFYFPIQALVGDLPARQLLAGLGMQIAWILIGTLLVRVMWRHGIRRFSAVGN